jgi:hypothetical protein
MKKFFVSLGLAAAGTAGLHAAYAPDSPDTSKMWSLSASLRGFYDDNINTTQHKQGSYGFEASPSFSLNMPLQQTEIGLRYTYGLYYYQQREQDGEKPIDQTHQLDLWLDHAFTPRWEARVQDTVTVGQDPELTASGTATPHRTDGNYIANTFTASLHTDWTQEFSTALTYQNSFYHYENTGATDETAGVDNNYSSSPISGYTYVPSLGYYFGGGSAASVNPSLAGLLDRVEQSIALDFQWHITPTTMALIGYQFGLVNFTGNELVSYSQPFPYYGPDWPVTSIYSSDRDNMSHTVYVGAQHEFLANLTGSVKAGVQYTDYYNDPSSTSSLGPYADASLIYTYASGSYAQLGVTQSRNATDTIQIDSQGHITLDQETTVAYGSINHALTSKLMASAVGHFQYSVYHDGQYNNQTAEFYNLGLDLSYAFNRNLSADLGYNFDWYTTIVPGQDYTRNRVYLGVTATY